MLKCWSIMDLPSHFVSCETVLVGYDRLPLHDIYMIRSLGSMNKKSSKGSKRLVVFLA